MSSTSCECSVTNCRRGGMSSSRDLLVRILLWFGEGEMVGETEEEEEVVGLVGFWSCS